MATFPVSIYFPQGERKFLSGSYLNYFYMHDRIGSVRGATSATGSAILHTLYFPYGPTGPVQPATTDTDFGYTGHLKCPFTSLTLAPYRVLGYANWLSRDPIGQAWVLLVDDSFSDAVFWRVVRYDRDDKERHLRR